MKNEGKWGVGSLFFCVNVSNNLSFLLEASQVAQQVKNPSVMQEMRETRVQSLGQEDPLEKGMAAHSSILVWRIPWTEEPGRLQSTGSQRVDDD